MIPHRLEAQKAIPFSELQTIPRVEQKSGCRESERQLRVSKEEND